MMRQRIIAGFLTIAATTWGCGPAAPPPKNPAQKTRTASRTVPSYNSSHAEKVRAATAKRRGSWSLSSEKVTAVSDLVAENAQKHSLSEDLLYGIIWVESRFDPRAVSPVGARGLMQLMPKTAKYLADCIKWDGRRSSFDPAFNISAGAYYIARLIREFKGNEELALAAYNAGPTKVRRWLAAGGLPDVSIEYASMVQTARGFFSHGGASEPLPTLPAGRDPQKRPLTETASIAPYVPEPASTSAAPVISDEALDRLGLAILIAGFHDDEFRAEKADIENPFE